MPEPELIQASLRRRTALRASVLCRATLKGPASPARRRCEKQRARAAPEGEQAGRQGDALRTPPPACFARQNAQALSSANVARLRRSAKVSMVPSRAAACGCGRPSPVRWVDSGADVLASLSLTPNSLADNSDPRHPRGRQHDSPHTRRWQLRMHGHLLRNTLA